MFREIKLNFKGLTLINFMNAIFNRIDYFFSFLLAIFNHPSKVSRFIFSGNPL